MTLLELAKSIMELYSQDWSGAEQQSTARFDQLTRLFLGQLQLCDDAAALSSVLDLNANLDMPFEVVKAVYERLLALGRGDYQTKRGYALWLKLHGPDWDIEADAILRELGEDWDTERN